MSHLQRCAVIFFCASLAGCGAPAAGGGSDSGESFDGGIPNLSALVPSVDFTSPLAGATGVPINSRVAATFTEAMDPASVTDLTFTLSGPNAAAVAGVVDYAGATAILVPASNLAANTVFQATIAGSTKDFAGTTLGTDFTWTFTTGSIADATAPTVTATTPLNAATAVATQASLTATFSKAMDPLTLTAATFTVIGPGAAAIMGNVDYDPATKTATFNPTGNLPANSLITGTINVGAKDLTGNALAGNSQWSFTTSADGALPSVALGKASSFAILAGSTVTSQGPTLVNGMLGLSPGTALTGFPPGKVNGAIHLGDPSAAMAKLALTTAYNDAAGRSTAPITVSGNLGGQTLAPGLYKSTSSLAISSGDLTLDGKGDSNATFIFQMASTLTTTSGRKVILSGGAKAANIFWQVGTSATLGTSSVFKGNLLADQSITVTTGATLEGRALTRIGAVTLDSNTVTVPAP